MNFFLSFKILPQPLATPPLSSPCLFNLAVASINPPSALLPLKSFLFTPDGSFSKCGRSKQKKDAKRKYPKCVPLAKARRMTEGQRRSAVQRKRAVAQGVGGKPTNVKTFAKRKQAMMGGFMARRMGMR